MKIRELYLDTTYVMPFLFLDINVIGFSRNIYKEILKSLDKIHISEISLIEAKDKSLKINLSRKNPICLSILTATKVKIILFLSMG